jgi:hypothetical protein
VIAQSVQRWATDWTIRVLGFDSRRGLWIFLFTTASRRALEPIQPPIQWEPGTLSLRVKRLDREADHSPPISVKLKNAWSYTSTPQYAFMAWCSVKEKHRDNFTFTFYLEASREVGLEVNTEKTKYIFVSHHQNVAQVKLVTNKFLKMCQSLSTWEQQWQTETIYAKKSRAD